MAADVTKNGGVSFRLVLCQLIGLSVQKNTPSLSLSLCLSVSGKQNEIEIEMLIWGLKVISVRWQVKSFKLF